MNLNQEVYESQKVVADYKKLIKLFPPEKVLFGLISNMPNKRTMLDLGIGTGRTTSFFASLFDHYVGIDFSIGMIEACKQRFSNIANTQFIHSDVTSLPKLPFDNFDFIQYSLNGIDYLKSIEDRTKLLSNIYKLLDSKGIFSFSTHNTKEITKLYSFQLPKRNPLKLIQEYFRYKKLREINGPISGFTNKKFFQLYDGGEYFKALTGYILPSYQMDLLKSAGFVKIQVVDLKGKTIPSDKVDSCHDKWIHYICYKTETADV